MWYHDSGLGCHFFLFEVTVLDRHQKMMFFVLTHRLLEFFAGIHVAFVADDDVAARAFADDVATRFQAGLNSELFDVGEACAGN